MATKKGSKSSKTAHVLNVLSGTKQDIPAEEDKLAAEEPQEREAEPAVSPPRPPVRAPILEIARANDEGLSNQIQQLLEEDWEQEEPQEEVYLSEQEEERQPLISEEPANTVQEETEEVLSELDTVLPLEEMEQSKQETTDALEQEPQAPVEQKKESSIPTAQEMASPPLREVPERPEEESKEDDFCHINVMQVLVDEKCMRYIKMFGMCDCSRCIADVKALALTNLLPKYLVMRRSEVIPMLTVYEGRFNAALTAQLIQACKLVMDHPRH